MQEWLKKICEYIMLYIAGPAAATIVAYLFERRKEKRDMALLLQIIIFDSKEKKDNSVRPELMKERLYVCRNSARI